jgi:hypothetical protein
MHVAFVIEGVFGGLRVQVIEKYYHVDHQGNREEKDSIKCELYG